MDRYTPRGLDNESSPQGFQLSPGSAASCSLRGGPQSLSTPNLGGQEQALLASSSQSSLQQASRGFGIPSSSHSQASLRPDAGSVLIRSSSQFSDIVADPRVPFLHATSEPEERVPEVPRLRPDWHPRLNQSPIPRRMDESPRFPLLSRQSSLEHAVSPLPLQPSTAAASSGAHLSRPPGSSPRKRVPESGNSWRSGSPPCAQLQATFSSPDLGQQLLAEIHSSLENHDMPGNSASSSRQDLADMAVRIERAIQDEFQGRFDTQQRHIASLQKASEVFEERLLQANSSILRIGAEHKQRLEELQSKLEDRGEIMELKHHLQWAEKRIHQLTARVAAGEELTEQLRQHMHGPGKAVWDVWEVTEARRDLEIIRDELTNLKTAGLVTHKLLGEAMDPLRRELRHLAERLVHGLNADVSAIVDKLMQEVAQVRESSARGEKIVQREHAVIKKDLDEISASIKKGLKDAGEESSFVTRKEFVDATQLLNQDLAALDHLVSGKREENSSRLDVENISCIAELKRDVSGLFGRTTMVRALAVNSAKIALDAVTPHVSNATLSKQHSEIAQAESGSNRSSLEEKREIASARTSLLLVGKSPEESVTTKEFLHAVQELRWDICRIDHLAESGYDAAGRVLKLEDEMLRLDTDLQQLRIRADDHPDTLDSKCSSSYAQGSASLDVAARLTDMEIAFERLRSMMGDVVNSVELGLHASPLTAGVKSDDGSTHREIAKLLGRVCITRAFAMHSSLTTV